MTVQNLSAFGLTGQIVASKTFPAGFNITQFADDTDPLDIPELKIADTAMGLNGDAITWSHPEMIEIVINVIPDGDADRNLFLLQDANRIAKNKQSAQDILTMTLTYPGGLIATLTEGIMITGVVSSPVQSSGRKKTKPYRFRFSNVTKVFPAGQ
jgi:hypothetical protein